MVSREYCNRGEEPCAGRQHFLLDDLGFYHHLPALVYKGSYCEETWSGRLAHGRRNGQSFLVLKFLFDHQ